MDYIDKLQKEQRERKEKIQKQLQNSYLSRNGLNPAEVLMLYYARSYTTEEDSFHTFWDYLYAIDNPHVLLNKLFHSGFICLASAKDSITHYKLQEIKELLKEQGLKLSGKKQELIDRLIDNSSSEYLEEKITRRNYELTELGKQELQENEYVTYFGQYEERYGFSIWDINKLLHDNPQSNYRDIIWGSLNKELYNSMDQVKHLDFHMYCRVKEVMAQFLLEEEGHEYDAFLQITEAIYYRINVHLFPKYKSGLRTYQDLLELKRKMVIENDPEEPNMKSYVLQSVSPYTIKSMLFKIKDKLDYSDSDFFYELQKGFSRLNCPDPIMDADDLAILTISVISEDNQKVDLFCKQLENLFFEKTNKSISVDNTNFPQSRLLHQEQIQENKPKKQSLLKRFFGK